MLLKLMFFFLFGFQLHNCELELMSRIPLKQVWIVDRKQAKQFGIRRRAVAPAFGELVLHAGKARVALGNLLA